MKKSLLSFVMLFVILVGTVSAQVENVKYDGYVMLKAPANGEKFNTRFAVANVTGSTPQADFKLEFNFAKLELFAAHAIVSDSAFGGEVEMTAGRMFMSVAKITPAPHEFLTTWWHEVFRSYTFTSEGINGSYKRNNLRAYLAWGQVASAAIELKGFKLLWQEGFGSTVAYQGELGKWVNPFVGVTYYRQKDKQYSFSNYSMLTENICIFGVAELGRVEDYTGGINIDLNDQVSLKSNYSFQSKNTHLEFICTF